MTQSLAMMKLMNESDATTTAPVTTQITTKNELTQGAAQLQTHDGGGFSIHHWQN